MEEKEKKRIKTIVEDLTLAAILPSEKESDSFDSLYQDSGLDEETIEDEADSGNVVINDDQSKNNNQDLYESTHESLSDSKRESRIQTLVNDDIGEYYSASNSYDVMFSDIYEGYEDIFDEDEFLNEVQNNTFIKKKASQYLENVNRTAGKITIISNRGVRTVSRLQEGKYTKDPNEMVKSMGKTAIAPMRRKSRNTAIRKTKKVIFHNRLSRAIYSVGNAVFKSIIKVVGFLIGIVLVTLMPAIIVLALLTSVFGGGYDESVITSYEKYMTTINTENKEYIDNYISQNPSSEVYSLQGNEYGFINWRAALSCTQVLCAEDLSFSQKEKNFLNELKENNLFEYYEETEEKRKIKNENGEEEEVTVTVLTIINPGIDDYIDYMIENYDISDMDQKAIRSLYVSADLMRSFSPEISGIYGGGKVFDDVKVQKLFSEGEKYLGYPYVWGGSSPSTSFDCSGFVCYVYTHSGTYELPRTTAQGIYDKCMPISEEDAKPGDLIFFTNTYDTDSVVTHVGIYAGDGIMLHCGDPIQYESYQTSYWQKHFYSFGRLKEQN